MTERLNRTELIIYVIHIHVSILFQILFPFRFLQNTEQSSLCYIVLGDYCILTTLTPLLGEVEHFICYSCYK